MPKGARLISIMFLTILAIVLTGIPGWYTWVGFALVIVVVVWAFSELHHAGKKNSKFINRTNLCPVCDGKGRVEKEGE